MILGKFSAAVASVAALLSVAGAAFASVEVFSDEKRDVTKIQPECGPAEEPCGERAPSAAAPDITKFKTRYRSGALVLSTSLRALPRGQGNSVDLQWTIFTSGVPKQRVPRWFVVGLTVRDGELAEGPALGRNCVMQGALARTVRNTVTLRVPADCLRHPRWVRTASETFASTEGSVFYDDALAPYDTANPDSTNGTLGPRQYRAR